MEADALLRRLLRAHLAHDGDVPPDYSLRLCRRAATRGPTDLSILFRASHRVSRSTSPGRVLWALCRQLDAHLPPPPGLVRINALTLVDRSGEALLVPAEVWYDADRYQPQLRRLDLRVLDVAHTDLDPASGAVVVRSVYLNLDPDEMGAIEAVGADCVPPGVYPVRAWLLAGVGTPVVRSWAQRVALAAALVERTETVTAQATLEALARALRSAEVVSLEDPSATGVAAALAARNVSGLM